MIHLGYTLLIIQATICIHTPLHMQIYCAVLPEITRDLLWLESICLSFSFSINVISFTYQYNSPEGDRIISFQRPTEGRCRRSCVMNWWLLNYVSFNLFSTKSILMLFYFTVFIFFSVFFFLDISSHLYYTMYSLCIGIKTGNTFHRLKPKQKFLFVLIFWMDVWRIFSTGNSWDIFQGPLELTSNMPAIYFRKILHTHIVW